MDILSLEGFKQIDTGIQQTELSHAAALLPIMTFGCLRQRGLHLLLVTILAYPLADAQRQWPRCLPAQPAVASTSDQLRQGISYLEVTASATGCSLALVQGTETSGSAARLATNAVIAGKSMVLVLLLCRQHLHINVIFSNMHSTHNACAALCSRLSSVWLQGPHLQS